MPDIAMCTGTDCPFAYRCYRAIAEPNELRQTYFARPPYDDEEGSCLYFWSLEEDEGGD